MEGFWLVRRSRFKSKISSGVVETQPLEAFSKRTRMSEMRGRFIGSRSQHCFTSTQTSSDRPKISRFVGREGHRPSRTSFVTAYGPTPENGFLFAKSYRSDPLGLIHRECDVANLVGNHPKRADVRLLRRMRVLAEQLRCHPFDDTSLSWRTHRYADRTVAQDAREPEVGDARRVIIIDKDVALRGVSLR